MAIVESNKQNVVPADPVKTRSTFKLAYEFFDTHRFGEYHPHFWFDGVEGDENTRLRSSHDVRSYTLKAPLLQDISMKKDYFMIPMEAILPLNWEKWNAIPVNGDDVSDTNADVGCGVLNFWYLVGMAWTVLRTAADSYFTGSTRTSVRMIACFLRHLIFGEYFYSSGSLINSLGARGSSRIFFTHTENSITSEYSYDEYFDAAITFLKSQTAGFTFYLQSTGVRYHVRLDGSPLRYAGTDIDVDVNTALQIMREDPYFQIVGIDDHSSPGASWLNAFSTFLNAWTPTATAFLTGVDNYNLSRVASYQLVCSHYYSNDHIDYIFSANLFRELIGNYELDIINGLNLSLPTFTYNGLTYQYDALCAHWFNLIITNFINTANSQNLLYGFQNTYVDSMYAYFGTLFSYRRSLRFLDFFTGTRSQALAVGNVNVAVGGSGVSVVDITKNIQRQRLFNAVNRVGAKWEHYIELMSGRKPAPDYHNPFFLGHTNDVVYGSESEYTGNNSASDIQNVTSVLRSNGGRYEFNIDFTDRPCIILGLTYYDLPRVYGRAFERQTFIMNRYDMFNKYLQFTGDQPVDRLELGVISPTNTTGLPDAGTFSYQTHDMQYKQRFNQLAGGFGVNSTQLDNWIYRADDVRTRYAVIDPDFIRSYCAEFDKFFMSVGGYSLGTYFHFIVRNINDSSSSRPMAMSPSIL